MIFETEHFHIDGLVLIKPKIFGDDRGYFYESYSKKDFKAHGIDCDFIQDNQALSSKGVLRGLHFQKPPYGQSKLVRVTQGKVFDVAVDVRPGSPTYGSHVGVELSDQNHHMLFIPAGFAHGYLVLSASALFQYKCDSYYHPLSESGIRYDDPSIAIDWPPVDIDYQISLKDANLPYL
ncbi:MAG: dTDP-4-dehydrorhamnose 3,5-epimerase [Saprospiraceae bacterium]